MTRVVRTPVPASEDAPASTSPRESNIVLAHRCKPKDDARTDTDEKKEHPHNTPISHGKAVPLANQTPASSELRSKTLLSEARTTESKEAVTNSSIKTSTEKPVASSLSTGAGTQKPVPKVPPGMKRWDTVEVVNGCRRHTVIIS
ncbi:MAG: hypothetical protein Q9178_003337 [Gyalolechia marmorata]